MSSKLPVLTPKQVIRALQRGGFYIHHQTGSHARLFHSTKPEPRVTVPIHGGDLPVPILKSILKQASLTEAEFLSLL